MKKKTSNRFFIMTILLCAILSSCQTGTEEPAIKISAGSEELPTIYYGDVYNEKQEEIEANIKEFMIGKRWSDLPSVTYGDTIQVQARNFEAEELEVYEYLLDQKGNIVSEYEGQPLHMGSIVDGKLEFIFESSYVLEQYPELSVEEKLVHGLVIRCKINNSSFAFSTLILGTED
ncbi:hypothetical protein JOC85_001896 [Bacillus mesophilus]|uniref:Uncharacterized protein n=1 Tax=Bacillus mesophilus TaxID=1808955 RepID=A0A6M0Q4N2_9BACI|nr:hypothetical protein [Bacillus mesophilus]MBM7661124.1 hypothetical protein [Bacillus mesophilus]NEY71347.1 hypothetical protein [Bacillus mesophilus]